MHAHLIGPQTTPRLSRDTEIHENRGFRYRETGARPFVWIDESRHA